MAIHDSKAARRYDLDWLKILATLILIPYHTARLFDNSDFYVLNAISSSILELFTRFVDQWFMPLFFFIAGASAKYSLDSRTPRQYCLERFQRLFIPLLFGIFIVIPPISYFGFLTHHRDANLSYYQYYPNFLRFNWEDIEGYKGTFTTSHLWFILYLLCFSLVTLPLLIFLRSQNGKHLIQKLAKYLLQNSRLIFLIVIPLSLARRVSPVYYNPVYYFLFFIFGYVFVLDSRFEEQFKKNVRFAFIFSFLGTMFNLYSRVSEFSLAFGELSTKNFLIQLLLSLNSLCWIIMLIFSATKYLNQRYLLGSYLNEASYPIYILHMTFVIVIGFYVVQWNVGVVTKFICITLAALISTLIIYDVLIRRFNITRILLGMKPKR